MQMARASARHILVKTEEACVDLKTKIEKFKEDEIEHKNMAYETIGTNKGFYSIMDKVIRAGSKIAITISEKI